MKQKAKKQTLVQQLKSRVFQAERSAETAHSNYDSLRERFEIEKKESYRLSEAVNNERKERLAAQSELMDFRNTLIDIIRWQINPQTAIKSNTETTNR